LAGTCKGVPVFLIQVRVFRGENQGPSIHPEVDIRNQFYTD